MNFPIPAGLLCYYPALNLSKESFSESLMLSLEDPLLSHSLMKICQETYLKTTDLDPKMSPFLSPLYANDSLIRRLPPVRLFVGTIDPLYDDTVKFAERLLTNGVDTKLFIYPGVYHGALNFAIKGGVKGCKRVVDDGTAMCKEIFDLNH